MHSLTDVWLSRLYRLPMHWNIYADRNGEWHWQKLDSHAAHVARSARGFAKREDCLADAREHGYAGEHDGPQDHGSDGPESR
jgi:hypothetical protein